MKKVIVPMSTLCLLLSAGTAVGKECINNRWQPTFVRHQAVAPIMYYYTGTTFVPVVDPEDAQDLCESEGVRDPVQGQTCDERPWTDFVCACNIEPPGNRTCAAFQNFVEEEISPSPRTCLAGVR